MELEASAVQFKRQVIELEQSFDQVTTPAVQMNASNVEMLNVDNESSAIELKTSQYVEEDRMALEIEGIGNFFMLLSLLILLVVVGYGLGF